MDDLIYQIHANPYLYNEIRIGGADRIGIQTFGDLQANHE
jgi:hypothetical protein